LPGHQYLVSILIKRCQVTGRWWT